MKFLQNCAWYRSQIWHKCVSWSHTASQYIENNIRELQKKYPQIFHIFTNEQKRRIFDFSKICFGQVSYSMLIEEFWVKFDLEENLAKKLVFPHILACTPKGMNVFKIWKLKLIFF